MFARRARYRDAMKTLLALLLVLAALPAHAQAKKPRTMDEALLHLQKAVPASAAIPAVEYIVTNATAAPSLQLFVGASAAVANKRISDGAFLFYVAQMRSRYDLLLFPPKGSGGENPTVLLAALNQQIGAEVNPAIMRDPKALAAVVKRVEAWTPAVPAGYEPGWAHTPGKKDAAQALFTAQRTEFRKRFGALSSLLADAEYFAAFRTVQDYNLATSREQFEDPKRKKAAEAAEAKMKEIETRRGIEGLYYTKP